MWFIILHGKNEIPQPEGRFIPAMMPLAVAYLPLLATYNL